MSDWVSVFGCQIGSRISGRTSKPASDGETEGAERVRGTAGSDENVNLVCVSGFDFEFRVSISSLGFRFRETPVRVMPASERREISVKGFEEF